MVFPCPSCFCLRLANAVRLPAAGSHPQSILCAESATGALKSGNKKNNCVFVVFNSLFYLFKERLC